MMPVDEDENEDDGGGRDGLDVDDVDSGDDDDFG